MATKDQKNLALAETHKHVRSVGKYINIFVKDLLERAEDHDDSKFEEPELSMFAENTDRLGKVEYGSKEYDKMKEELKPALDNHYAKNRHHPEHWPSGVNDMTLLDIIEMISDWKASTARNKNGNIRNSIEMNSKKYKINPQLRKILENTVREYFTE